MDHCKLSSIGWLRSFGFASIVIFFVIGKAVAMQEGEPTKEEDEYARQLFGLLYARIIEKERNGSISHEEALVLITKAQDRNDRQSGSIFRASRGARAKKELSQLCEREQNKFDGKCVELINKFLSRKKTNDKN